MMELLRNDCDWRSFLADVQLKGVQPKLEAAVKNDKVQLVLAVKTLLAAF